MEDNTNLCFVRVLFELDMFLSVRKLELNGKWSKERSGVS